MTMRENLALTVAMGAVGLAAAVTDYRDGKIYNWLTFPAMAVGLGLALFHGREGVEAALLGLAAGFALFFPLFVAGVFGAGDVKLAMALGTALGAAGTWRFFVLSLAVGAAGSVALLVRHRRVKPFLRELHGFFRSLLVRELEVQWPRLSREAKAPFGPVLFLAYMIEVADRW